MSADGARVFDQGIEERLGLRPGRGRGSTTAMPNVSTPDIAVGCRPAMPTMLPSSSATHMAPVPPAVDASPRMRSDSSSRSTGGSVAIEPSSATSARTRAIASTSRSVARRTRTAPRLALRLPRVDVVIAGGHGQIALHLERMLAERGDRARGLIRNPDHASDLEAIGAEPVVCDMEAEQNLSTVRARRRRRGLRRRRRARAAGPSASRRWTSGAR